MSKGMPDYDLWERPQVFGNGNFVLWRKILLLDKGNRPPVRKRTVTTVDAAIVDPGVNAAVEKVIAAFENLEKQHEENRLKFPEPRGLHAWWATQKKNDSTMMKRIWKLRVEVDQRRATLEDQLMTICVTRNREQAQLAKNELEECKQLLSEFDTSPDLMRRTEYLKNVGGVYAVWFKQRKLKPPVFGVTFSGQQSDSRRYAIKEFQRICERRQLKKGETILRETKFGIAFELGVMKADDTETSKRGKSAYQVVSEYASRLGYVEPRRTKEDTRS